MLVVILGAGASYDSVNLDHDEPLRAPEHLQFRPPLAAELFAPRPNFRVALAAHQQARPVVPRIRRRIAEGVLLEDELSLLQAESAAYPARHQQLLAVQCYLQSIVHQCSSEWLDRSGHATHYHELVDTIESWRRRQPLGTQDHDEVVTYITFNYDLMLEDALATVYGWIPKSEALSDYGDDARYRLVKPHGSVDWSRLVPRPTMPTAPGTSWLWQHAGQYPLGGYVKAGTGVGTYRDLGYVPAIAVPVHDKDAFACPDDQLQMIEAAVRQSTRVLCVGWRGMEKEFLAKWANRSPAMQVLVASGPIRGDGSVPARETWGNMVSGGFPKDIEPVLHEGGFGSLVGSSDLADLLG